ncbi:hypothetical protein HK104_004920 [Borealophlyctis nickersoniae]|nr:hypothetical protein HK104_004920 [Borealophlyctis nickersoniae]
MGYYLSESELAVAIATLDTDGDGEISYDEFLDWWVRDDRFWRLQLSEEQAQAVQRATEYFQHFDRSDKGYVDATEFAYMFADMRRWNGFFRQDITLEEALVELRNGREANVGGEGVISFNDYVNWLIRIGSIKGGKGG